MHSAERITSIDQARGQAPTEKTSGLTELERQWLLKEVAEMAIELNELQSRAADIMRRVKRSTETRANRSV